MNFFVRFLAMRKLVPETLEFALTTEKASRVSIVTTLSKEQVDTIRAFNEKSSSPSELRSAAMTILALRMGLRSVARACPIQPNPCGDGS